MSLSLKLPLSHCRVSTKVMVWRGHLEALRTPVQGRCVPVALFHKVVPLSYRKMYTVREAQVRKNYVESLERVTLGIFQEGISVLIQREYANTVQTAAAPNNNLHHQLTCLFELKNHILIRIKGHKRAENVLYNFPELKCMSSDCLFCLTKQSKM